jgi:hypothetical protein
MIYRSSHEDSAPQRRLTAVASIAAAGLILSLIGCQPTPLLPADAQDLCPLPAATFASWFESGSVTLNGVVNPANSTVVLNPNCGFYAWSEQMFMWLTSPAPASYGGGRHIFDSPAFFDVTPPDASGSRTLLPHIPGKPRALVVRAAKLGPQRLPVVVDRSGRLLQVKAADPQAKPLVRDPSGAVVEISHARLENGRTILLDADGKIVAAQHAETVFGTSERKNEPALVNRFLVDRVVIFIDASLAVIDVEQGQAGDQSVLQAQLTANGSLIYYATMVNDVYAYFLTGVKKGAFTTTTPNQFPTTVADLNNTIAFATAHGKPSPPFPDPKALAVEVKSAWVIASGLPDLSSYITMTATIPTYTKSSSTLWTQSGQRTVELALVGMHVVGSAVGHPELVWATFEHVGSAPLSAYSYSSTSGPKTVPQSTSGNWLLTASNSSGAFNIPHMAFTGPGVTPANSIQAEPSFTISPSDTIRVEPFGLDGSNAPGNTQVISMDNHILALISSGDVRGNYIMTGATWTVFGSNPGPGNLGVGTNKLANTAMETYAQGTNCFSCHQNDNSNLPQVTTEVSHIFPGIQPLF